MRLMSIFIFISIVEVTFIKVVKYMDHKEGCLEEYLHLEIDKLQSLRL